MFERVNAVYNTAILVYIHLRKHNDKEWLVSKLSVCEFKQRCLLVTMLLLFVLLSS